MTRRKPQPGRLPVPKQKELAQWLKAKNCHCPACGSKDWGEANTGALRFAPGVTPGTTTDFPALMLTCKDCGYLSLFCAFTTGIVQETPKDT